MPAISNAVIASDPASPRSDATAQPDDFAALARHSWQSYVIDLVPPSGAGSVFVQVAATQSPRLSWRGPAVMHVCPGELHEPGGTSSARAGAAPMASVATSAATAAERRPDPRPSFSGGPLTRRAFGSAASPPFGGEAKTAERRQ